TSSKQRHGAHDSGKPASLRNLRADSGNRATEGAVAAAVSNLSWSRNSHLATTSNSHLERNSCAEIMPPVIRALQSLSNALRTGVKPEARPRTCRSAAFYAASL